MNYDEAVKIYIAHRPMAQRIIARIEKWDAGKTAKENWKLLGGNSIARNLADDFELPYKGGYKEVLAQLDHTALREALWMARAGGRTLDDIAKSYGVSRQRIHQLTKKNGRIFYASCPPGFSKTKAAGGLFLP